MFDIGFWELLIIGMVTLLVVGPDRLPGMATFIGHWVGRARRFTNHMRREIQEEFEAEQLKNLVNEQQRELNSLRQEVEGVRDDAATAARDVERDFGDPAQADARSRAAADTGSSSAAASSDAGVTNESAEPSPDEPGAGASADRKGAATDKQAAGQSRTAEEDSASGSRAPATGGDGTDTSNTDR